MKTAIPAAVPASPEPLSDGELAQRVAGGDVRAFEALMRRHNRTLFRTSRAILRDDADAEEALQDGYLRAFRAIGAFRFESRLSTWLVRIVANEALMRLRKRRRGAEVVPLHGDDMPTEDRPDYAAQRAETRRLLEQKIDALPEAYRVVFILRALEEFSVEETAAALGIPEMAGPGMRASSIRRSPRSWRRSPPTRSARRATCCKSRRSISPCSSRATTRRTPICWRRPSASSAASPLRQRRNTVFQSRR